MCVLHMPFNVSTASVLVVARSNIHWWHPQSLVVTTGLGKDYCRRTRMHRVILRCLGDDPTKSSAVRRPRRNLGQPKPANSTSSDGPRNTQPRMVELNSRVAKSVKQVTKASSHALRYFHPSQSQLQPCKAGDFATPVHILVPSQRLKGVQAASCPSFDVWT